MNKKFVFDNSNWIETSSRLPFCVNVEKYGYVIPSNVVIKIEDIAHSLSMQCRFNGHCPTFYSVAQHCLLVYKLYTHNEKERPTDLSLLVLLHDAAEAYFGDIPAPFKGMFPDIKAFEDAIQLYILRYFKVINRRGFDPDEYMKYQEQMKIVKKYDLMALAYEKHFLFPDIDGGFVWNSIKDIPIDKDDSYYTIISDMVKKSYMTDNSKATFLQTFRELTEKLIKESFYLDME